MSLLAGPLAGCAPAQTPLSEASAPSSVEFLPQDALPITTTPIAVGGDKTEQGFYRDDFNVLMHELPEGSYACHFDCLELDEDNAALFVNYKLEGEESREHYLILRYNRPNKEEISVYDGLLDISSGEYVAGEKNSFAVYDDRQCVIFKDDKPEETVEFNQAATASCRYLSPDFRAAIFRDESGKYSIIDLSTGETLLTVENADFLFPIFEKNLILHRDWNGILFATDLKTGEQKQCAFNGHISNARYDAGSGRVFFLDADQAEQTYTMTVYALDPDAMRMWRHIHATLPDAGNNMRFDFDNRQFSYVIESETGCRVRTIGIYNEYSLVTDREFTRITRINYCGNGFLVYQNLGAKMLLIYI